MHRALWTVICHPNAHFLWYHHIRSICPCLSFSCQTNYLVASHSPFRSLLAHKSPCSPTRRRLSSVPVRASEQPARRLPVWFARYYNIWMWAIVSIISSPLHIRWTAHAIYIALLIFVRLSSHYAVQIAPHLHHFVYSIYCFDRCFQLIPHSSLCCSPLFLVASAHNA